MPESRRSGWVRSRGTGLLHLVIELGHHRMVIGPSTAPVVDRGDAGDHLAEVG